MIAALALGPGSALPQWLERLEIDSFGDSWGALADHERLWVEPGAAFARWSVVEAAGEAELLRIAVAPAARRQGLGQALLRAAEADLRTAGIQHLHLEVRTSNGAARSLYEAEGWRLSGHRPRYYRDGEDAVVYTKKLTSPAV